MKCLKLEREWSKNYSKYLCWTADKKWWWSVSSKTLRPSRLGLISYMRLDGKKDIQSVKSAWSFCILSLNPHHIPFQRLKTKRTQTKAQKTIYSSHATGDSFLMPIKSSPKILFVNTEKGQKKNLNSGGGGVNKNKFFTGWMPQKGWRDV